MTYEVVCKCDCKLAVLFTQFINMYYIGRKGWFGVQNCGGGGNDYKITAAVIKPFTIERKRERKTLLIIE